MLDKRDELIGYYCGDAAACQLAYTLTGSRLSLLGSGIRAKATRITLSRGVHSERRTST